MDRARAAWFCRRQVAAFPHDAKPEIRDGNDGVELGVLKEEEGSSHDLPEMQVDS